MRQRETSTHGPPRADVERRSELARALVRGVFPADRDELARYLERTGATEDLVDEVAALPGGRIYENIGDLAVSLGLSAES